MVFSSLVFLCIFLPVVLVLYYVLPGIRLKNALLILASLFFYAYGEPVYVLLMLFSTVINYLFGLWVSESVLYKRKILLWVNVIINLGMLGVFKYTDMLIETLNQIFGINIHTPGIVLPIGISFYTFQAMSYVIDVYRNQAEAQKKYGSVLLYISFFPQLIAGPIVKYHDIEQQIHERNHDIEKMALGLRRFIAGLSKKVFIANSMAKIADAVFAMSADNINLPVAWLGAIAYMLQIYYDFSGYSDMAIGLGHMFGFTFLENFNYPYNSRNIQEFWRKWHISLSTWFKEYLYIPLGGNRKGRVRACVNKLIVFFCTGLWHGANWTFVIWGLFHGFFLLIEAWLPIKKLPQFLGRIYTLLVVCIGFVMFRADTLSQGLYVIKQMFVGFSFEAGQMIGFRNLITGTSVSMLVLGIIFMFPVTKMVKDALNRCFAEKAQVLTAVDVCLYIGSFIMLFLCMISLAGGGYNPFIYFRF